MTQLLTVHTDLFRNIVKMSVIIFYGTAIENTYMNYFSFHFAYMRQQLKIPVYPQSVLSFLEFIIS